MRIERLRMGLELLNKVNGEEYKVVDVDGATGTAAEMIKDPVTGLNSVGEEEVTITEENALAFRILSDPEPYPVPEGYSIEDGVLLKDGKPACIQGEFSFIRIFAALPDCIPEEAGNAYPKGPITKRNQWLVENSDLLIAYVRRETGEAAACLKMAEKAKIKIIRI